MKKFTLILSLMIAMATSAMAQVTKTKVDLTIEAGQPGYISSPHDHALINPNSPWDQGGVAAMIDGDVNTHFHTAWENIPAGPHYFEVDMGEGNTIGKFCFDYVTRNGCSDDWAREFTIKGSNDGTDFELITVVDFGSNAKNGSSHSSEVLGSNDKVYRYLRFEVTNTNVQPHISYRIYFHIAEFALYTVKDETTVEPSPEPTPDPEEPEKPEESNPYEEAYAAIAKPTINGAGNTTFATAATISNGNGIENNSENIIPAELAVSGQKGRTDFIEIEAGAKFDLNITYTLNWNDITIVKIEKGISEIVYGPFEGTWTEGGSTEKVLENISNAGLAVNEKTVTYPIALSNDLQEGDMVVIRTITANDFDLDKSEYSEGSYMDFVFVVPTKNAETAIENVNVETANNAIYDITGRRVKEITNAGIYIINGKKTFVK